MSSIYVNWTLSYPYSIALDVISRSFPSCNTNTNIFNAQSTCICRVQSSVWRLLNYWAPTPSPPRECVLPPFLCGGYTHTRPAVRGQYFGRRQTLEWPLTVLYNPSTLLWFQSSLKCLGCVEGEETAARGVAAAIRLWGKVSQPLFTPDYFHDHTRSWNKNN